MRVRKGGKSRLELDLGTSAAGLPAADLILLGSKGQEIGMDLIVGGFGNDVKALLKPLGSLQFDENLVQLGQHRIEDLNSNAPAEWEVERYQKREEINWKFNEPRKAVSSLLSLIWTVGGIWIGPTLVLLVLVSLVFCLSRIRSSFCTNALLSIPIFNPHYPLPLQYPLKPFFSSFYSWPFKCWPYFTGLD